MNFVRRIVNSKVESNNNRVGITEQGDQSLNQLKTLFAEFKSILSGPDLCDHDDLLYDIIPLFHKIFCSTPGAELCERFPDVFVFCTHVSNLMVKEIKNRATNQKTEEASLAIVQYLQPNISHNSSNDENKGFVLLNVLNILSRGPAAIIDCMISASLPSTFVKCLYIFFDLPNSETNCNQQHDSVFSMASSNKCCKYDPLAIHRRNILLDNFKQVLQRICFYPATTEELVRKEDLRLLFGAVASWCPIHNSGWRKAAADVLQTIAHNGLSQSTIQHIYHKKLISQCLKNVTKGGLRSIEIVDIFVTLFHLLRESSDVNQMLLDDFRNSQGYAIIEDFLIKLEKEISNETEQDSIRSLIILIAKLTTCGYVELRPKQNLAQDIIYPIEGFELPMPMNKNESIRNYYAFNVLQSVFLHAETDFLCLRILEAIKTIYQQDPANYFILEPQNTFQAFSEKLHKKSLAVQEELINLIDCIVITLNYVPVKEISSLTLIMKSCSVAVTTSLLVKTFIRLIEHNKIFRDVWRDLGILEMAVNQLHSYAHFLKKEQEKIDPQYSSNEQNELGLLIIEFLTLLINNCPKNIELFRKIGGTGCIFSLVNFERSQMKALELIKVITLSSSSDEDMTNFMGLIRSTNQQNLFLKIRVIESLFTVMKESHRCRIIFKKVHSFVIFVQELVHLGGCFSPISKPPWDIVNKNDLIEYIKCILSVLTMAMKKEPSNVRYFSLNVSYASMTEAIRNLGCFGSDVDIISHEDSALVTDVCWATNPSFQMENVITNESKDSLTLRNAFEKIFQNTNCQEIFDNNCETVHQTILACCLLKLIYDNAIGSFDSKLLEKKSRFILRSDSRSYMKTKTSSDICINPNLLKSPVPTNSCNLIIIHPEAIISMLHLIPAIRSDQNQLKYQIELQVFILEKIVHLFSNDRNLQTMCDSVSMPLELLNHFQFAMINENHPLHSLTLSLFERLSTQKVTPKNVRDFLRLDNPLCCQPIVINKDYPNLIDLSPSLRYQSHNCDEFKFEKSLSTSDCCAQNLQCQRKNGGPISLTRVKSLIGITTQQNQSDRVCVPIINDATGETDYSEMRFAQIPSFVEMNMSYEGYAFLFLPSIAPQNASSGISSVGLVSPIENNIIGGIGIGERVFPPTGGFSFSTWICVQKFSSNASSHPIRLLTLARSVQGSNEFISCLNISIVNSPNHAILVSSKEEILGNKDQESNVESIPSEYVVDFPCEMLIQEHCWIHLLLTFHRPGMIKHSSCSCYLNGQLVDTKKLNYISPNVSSSFGSMGSLITSVYAYIGTMQSNHKISNLCWRQGPVHFIEEPLSPQVVSNITRLGPNYIGNFQNPLMDYEQPIGSLVAEEKIVFCLYANNISVFTLARINKIYNELDGAAIARQLHLHPKEKTSPIRIIHNAAGHLSGAGRTLGAILVGFEGIRSFNPAPMTKMLDCVGGSKVLLGILAMANDAESLYAVVKSVCLILIDNRSLLKELEKHLGYKLISFLLKKKRHLLSSRIFSLLVGLTGSSDQEFQDIKIEKGKPQIYHISSLNKSFNRNLFGEIICDLNLWLHCKNVDNSNNQLLGNVLRHIREFFQKCVDSKYTGESNEKDIKMCRSNSILKFVLDLNLMERIIDLLMQLYINPHNQIIIEPLSKLIELILTYTNRPDDLRKFGQLMVWTLSALGTSETLISLNDSPKSGQEFESVNRNIIYLIEIRNMCFRIILKILNGSINADISEPKIADELLKYLGFDWILLFMQPDVHPTTVILAMRCLISLLSVPQYIAKFRDGILCSGWLNGTDVVLQKRHGLLLMDNIRDQPAALREISLDSCHLPGFIYLQSLLPHHCRIPDIYFMLIALLLGNKIKTIPDNLKFEFESVCNFLFGNATEQNLSINKQSSGSSWAAGPLGAFFNKIDYQNSASKKSNVVKKSVEMCSEAATILLTMMRVMLNQNCNECDNENHMWIRDYPVTLLRFFVYLYHSNGDFQSVAMQSDFLIGLTGAMYPSSDAGMKSSPKKVNLFSPESINLMENEKCGNIYSPNRNNEMITLESISSLPARKLIMDFFKMIIVDNFALSPRTSTQHIIDTILECEIENTTSEHMKQFQTVFMNSLAEHFMAVDILSGQNLPLPTGGSYANIPNNIYYFFSRVVDKVWQEIYVDDPDIVLSFICRLVSQGRKRQIPIESLFRSFNRLILFQLYRPTADLKNKHFILNTLQKIIKNNDISSFGNVIFNPANIDAEFTICLVHLLFQLVNGTNIVGGSTWYSTSDSALLTNNPDKDNVLKYKKMNDQIRFCSDSLWQEIFNCKKQLLEETFKGQLSPQLTSISPNFEQICLKTWNNYIDSENNGTASSHWGRVIFNSTSSGGKDSSGSANSNMSQSLQHQISIKLNRMSRTSVLGRLSNSTSINTGSDSGSYPSNIGASRFLTHMSIDEARLWIPPHISVVKELMEYNKTVLLKKESFMMHYLDSKWKLVESELNRERGIWGPITGSPLDKWLLDSAEGPCRMRKKMVPNEFFYQHYPYRPQHRSPGESSETPCQIRKFKVASSSDSELNYYFDMSKSILKLDDCEDISSSMEINESTKSTTEVNINCSSEDPEESLRNTESLLRGRKSIVDILDSSFTRMQSEDKLDDDWQETKFKSDDTIDPEDEETFNKDTTDFPDNTEDSDFSHEQEKQPTNDTKSKKQLPDSSPTISHQSHQRNESLKKPTHVSTQWDNQVAIEHMIGSDEKIHFMFRCARIQGLDVHEGLLLFGQSYFYIIDGFTLLKTREIVEINNIPVDVHEPIVPSTPTVNTVNQRRKMSDKFSFGEIREVHKRRYLLQPIAIEVFFADGRNFLLAFPKKMQNKIYAKFIQVASALTLNAQQSISGQKQNSKIESGSSSIFSNFMGEKSVTQRWEKGEISNFQYLMHLNTLAGRSYNDLMQYPVFPWILADYDSENLDLSSPSTFRQLDKPMGAQSENRLNQFEKRYQEWDDPTGETPPYHYGTHYSSAMIVAFYLVRMEPFTQHFLKLQGGHFDLADRMFHSIKDTWESASQHNMADIKELIPEFFYLPNFLTNTNKFELGYKQNGVLLGDILLPPWAKGDPREFIRAHREALECDYVSAHLNEWIDLIFGYKQLGEPAVESVNVFHHLFYEGNVDIYSIDDPLKRSAVIGFINNFGQIPKQLFKRPHPTKRLLIPHSISSVNKQIDPTAPMASSAPAERLFYHNLDNMEPSLQPVKELKNAVGQIIQVDSSATNSNSSGSVPGAVLAVEQNKCLIPPFYTRYVAWGFSDGSLRIGNYDSDKLVKVYEMPDPYGDIMCVLCLNERTLITGGFSTVVRVWNMCGNSKNSASSVGSGTRLTNSLAPALSLKANLYGHIEAVTCLTVAASYNLLISGSRDRTCIMWDLGRMCYLRTLAGHAAPVAAVCISEVSGMVASCAGTYLHLWSIDGEELSSVNTATGRSKQILTVTMSTMMDWDPGNVVITGGTDGVVRMWSLEYVQVPVSTSMCSVTQSSGDLNEPQIIYPQPGFDSVSSICESSNLEEDEFEEELWQSSRVAENKSQTTTLTRSKSGTYNVDNCNTCSEEIEDDYVVIGTTETNNDNPRKAFLTENNPTEKSLNSKPPHTLLKSMSQPQMRPNMRKLRKGFHWQRQLIFRSKLTMHTAYERSDNANPSPVSSVAISRDHRSIYVGDHRGRVFCWSVPQEPGRSMADHWIRDENAEVCTGCKIKFSLTERRHHCRNCGLVFCNKCSKYETEIHRLRLFKPVRVCVKCYNSINSLQYN